MIHYLVLAMVWVGGIVGYLTLFVLAISATVPVEEDGWVRRYRWLLIWSWLAVTVTLVALFLHDYDTHPEHYQRHYRVETVAPSQEPG